MNHLALPLYITVQQFVFNSYIIVSAGLCICETQSVLGGGEFSKLRKTEKGETPNAFNETF